ncbi:phenylalanine--tRNA ligase subunit beta [Priestia taiwanensis]|uniref:Phenylalanine--tRNA ligase beta subunit n=1 Tax=Priestia taiwanensis TaxID=1347902 RepID=A0A917ESZ2_9BACI|nr:phenylalanine--tRNA ligase subunit beta [Priestia taiwanensis]MBM7363502.1 phenylalanyl-tRNA synthetase beta chain [Priestia taiwanensis]GGE76582.1 phenylalanine--tRNA ligase beta subunit [Priestia taiwanensis]
MFVSYRWLQEYVDLQGKTADELAELITKSGIEVEAVEKLDKGITGVVIGHVLEREKHPEADKLSKCLVDIGAEEPVQIICGAPNVAQGQKVPVATVGAVLPGNFKIKKAKLRGEVSMGMICALEEIGVESKLVAKEYQEGIFVFPSDAEVGQNALEYLQLHDSVLELSLTPNRADCLNMLGVAYEVAAILRTDVKLPEVAPVVSAEKTSSYINVSVEAKEENPLYIAKMVKGIKVAESPLWMQARLMAAGVRPINNIVDITNYVLMEYGQPLHAFDYNKLDSKEIVVRMANEGEKIVTLDDTERELKASHLVITNGKEAIAVAGVMGGANTEVDGNTVDVLVEAAVFNNLLVRATSKDVGLRSESSVRFEKGIDPQRTKAAIERAAALMQELAGGEVLEGVVEVNNLTITEPTVEVTVTEINDVLGMTIDQETIASIFGRLGFAYREDNGTFFVTIPTRRPDITIPEDLVEEVGRIYGYDDIPVRYINKKPSQGTLTPYQAKRRKVRRYLEGAGLFEAVTYSLTSPDKATRFTQLEDVKPVRLALPMSEDRSELRLSLIPHLLDSVSYNVARKNDSVSLYEIASIFVPTQEGELPTEVPHLASVMTGLTLHHPWQGEKKAVDFFVLKGIVEGLVDLLGLTSRVTFVKGKMDDMHPGRTANVLLDGNVIGFIGQLHPETQKSWGLKETYVFELSLAALLHADVQEVSYTQIPRFPSMTRDMAVVVDTAVEAGAILATITETGGKLLKDVSLFDVYVGDNVEEGKKSLAFSLRYFDPERTLTDEEVTKVHDKVLAKVEEVFAATLRA